MADRFDRPLFLGLGGRLDDLLGDMCGHLVIVGKFHREDAAPAGEGAEVRGIGLELGHGDVAMTSRSRPRSPYPSPGGAGR